MATSSPNIPETCQPTLTFAALHVISVSWVALEVYSVTVVLGWEGEVALSVVDLKNDTMDWLFS